MLDTRPVSLSTPMRTHSGARTMEHTYQHSYEHDYSSKHTLTAPVEPQEGEDAEETVLRELLEAFPGFSLEVIAAAYMESDSNVNVAAEILTTRQPVMRTLHRTGVQEGRKAATPNRSQNGFVRQSGEEPVVGSDDLLLQKYGRGVGEHVIRSSKHPESNQNDHMHRNSQHPSIGASQHPPYVNNPLISGASGDCGSSLGGYLKMRESTGTLGEGVWASGKKKKKKKKKNCIDIEEVEPKDAASRRAVEEFMLSMIGEGFQLGNDVVRDVLGYFEGDTQKSLDMLLQMASCTSGLGLNSDNGKTGLKNAPHPEDKELGVRVDPLLTLMGAFPNEDPAQVVMAFQEHHGDVGKVSNALLLAGEGASNSHIHEEAMTKEEIDQDHCGARVLFDQLKAVFPAVDNNFLFEVLQSTYFVLRDAERVLLDAGLTPAYEHAEGSAVPSKVERSKLSHTILNNLHKDSGETSISTQSQPLRALWADMKPTITPLEQNWAVVTTKESPSDKSGAERKKTMPQFKSYGDTEHWDLSGLGVMGLGDFDDYGRYRQCSNEHYRTMQYYFREAAAAYGRGERCRAGTLSEKGKEYKQLAREADERASQRIFNHRNKDIENNITIDLHAQHVNEAIQVLKLHLQSLSCIPSVSTLTVITGYGSHSSNGRARIKPAVTRFLTKRGIPWKEANVGCLVIKMKDAHNKVNSADNGSTSENE